MNFVLLTPKPWHKSLFESLSKRTGEQWTLITEKEDFTPTRLSEINPTKIFIPHWSHIIKPEIFDAYECVVFHMTDLPYGRGGSPLQNLIVEGQVKTKVSAIRVTDGIDTGDVYLKQELSLEGTALEIFQRSSEVIHEMIKTIIKDDLKPSPQTGFPTFFKRRKAEDSNLADLNSLHKVYDYIRMLDCEGYPKAFIETEHFRFEFDQAAFKNTETLEAHVRIIKK